MPSLEAALQQFEATEANLEKLDKLWEKIYAHISGGPAFGSPPEYDELCLAFRGIMSALPAIRSVSTSLRQVASEFSVENLLSRLM
jgi:hypothetical protein